ncbi:MAG TPA: MMPL family transporter [Gammaproteobacteria bacterium]|nr:MMPL family transporter [Gammaproteobacteria bacterium]
MSWSKAARWLVWAISLGLLCGFAWSRLDLAQPINTNILTLLPAQNDSAALTQATERTRNAFVHELLALVSGTNAADTRAAAEAARRAMLAAGLQAENSGQTFEQAQRVFQRHHFALLNPAQAKHLRGGGAKALATDVAVSLASPAGMVSANGRDPGGYLTQFLADLPRPYPDFLPNGPFLSATRDGRHYFLLRLEVRGAAFAKQGSALAAAAVSEARNAVQQACADCRFEATGAPLFADAARREAKSETIWLTVISTLLIMALIAFVYRSFAPHVLAALQLVASVAAAAAAVIAIFGSINILTLVFGTTLLGIAIDYAFLYFAEYWFGSSPPRNVMRKIRGGLGVALAAGALAFAFLAGTGFPALMQIAVFSVAGLLEAGLVVALIFPVTLTRPPTVAAHPAVNWPRRFIARACRPSHWRYIMPAVLLALAIPGWFFLHASDDVRELQHFPPRLMHTDQHIRTILGRFPPPGFFLIEAPDLNQALAREETLFAHVAQQLPQANAVGLSRFLPSTARQQASLVAWQSVFASPAKLRAAFAQMGLPPALGDHIETAWHAAPRDPLTAQELFAAVPDLHKFVIRTNDGVALLATVFGQSNLNAAALRQAAAGLANVQFVDPLARIADTFERIRVRASWLVVIGYLLISGILVWRYGRREALRMLWPPLLALGVTLGALGWIGVPLNVFVVVALILILGLGRDYAVFLREVGARERSPALAVTLSAMTTLLSFGLLSLSQIPALSAFGLATLIGILASYLSAPLSLPPERENP